MPDLRFIEKQLGATEALVKFIDDHHDAVPEDLQLCLRALERKDIDSAVRHARLVKPWGMGSLTDWAPPVVQPLENPRYNNTVMTALVNHWCNVMSLSFDEIDRTNREAQAGALDARVNSKGYVFCPFCHKTFSQKDKVSWQEGKHITCGVRLNLVSADQGSGAPPTETP